VGCKVKAYAIILSYNPHSVKSQGKIDPSRPLKLIHYLGWAPLVLMEKENIVKLKKSFWSIEFLHFLNSIHHRKLDTSVLVFNDKKWTFSLYNLTKIHFWFLIYKGWLK